MRFFSNNSIAITASNIDFGCIRLAFAFLDATYSSNRPKTLRVGGATEEARTCEA